MALQQHDIKNFETLKLAFKNGDVALVESADTQTGEYRAVICAMMFDNGEYLMAPFAILPWENPFEMLVDPTTFPNETQS